MTRICRMTHVFSTLLLVMFALCASGVHAANPWNVYDGFDGPGKGKHIVLVSGDEEYRSEEALSQLGKILARHHGFKCTVLYAIDPETGVIDSNNQRNIPGLEALSSADLMIIATRFRNLPGEQMKHIDDYLRRGGPVIGMRTATHAFKIRGGDAWAHYGDGYNGDKKAWKGGFGRLVLGEKWISHHGRHGRQSTRGLTAPGAEGHPVLRGIKDGDIWGPTDVYGVRLPLPRDSKPIVLGQVLAGMNKDDEPLQEEDRPRARRRNDPMMPVGWTKSYQIPGGKKGKSFTTTMGASTDLVATGTRRMLVNAAYWLLGMEVPAGGGRVDVVGDYKPTDFGSKRGNFWKERGLRPSDFALK